MKNRLQVCMEDAFNNAPKMWPHNTAGFGFKANNLKEIRWYKLNALFANDSKLVLQKKIFI